ncbi:hypothetical protein [Bifidobacterium sp. SO4]|uniref:hypothetical protein n=1 Tax=Bifidobacterium sp. SO4 TaxID=2809030 RepID=UPI001BDC7757|nr:hypothetical protein [Bifidobacterium sp. SO4]MBT1169605.1 hypothetical protein [Bifidobacterium sp. SO4]
MSGMEHGESMKIAADNLLLEYAETFGQSFFDVETVGPSMDDQQLCRTIRHCLDAGELWDCKTVY